MNFDGKKLEREDAERWDRSGFSLGITYVGWSIPLALVLLATGRLGDRWLSVALPMLPIGVPALIVRLRRRKRNVG